MVATTFAVHDRIVASVIFASVTMQMYTPHLYYIISFSDHILLFPRDSTPLHFHVLFVTLSQNEDVGEGGHQMHKRANKSGNGENPAAHHARRASTLMVLARVTGPEPSIKSSVFPVDAIWRYVHMSHVCLVSTFEDFRNNAVVTHSCSLCDKDRAAGRGERCGVNITA